MSNAPALAPRSAATAARPIGTMPATRAIRRPELLKLVPLADTTIYEMEKRGEFPRRYPLTRRCVVWDLAEVEAWLEARKQAGQGCDAEPAEGPDVRTRRARPARSR